MLRKVKAHIDRDRGALMVLLASDLPLDDFVGNKFADALANRGAELARVPFDIRANHEFWAGRMIKIAKRLVAINRMCFEEGAFDVKAYKRAPTISPLDSLLQKSGHFFGRVSGAAKHNATCRLADRRRCKYCNVVVAQKSLLNWLRKNPKTCSPPVPTVLQPSAARPAVVDGQVGPIVVGKGRVIHSSHHPLFTRGLWWCNKCGFYATAAIGCKSSARKLVERCDGPVARAGQDYLKRLRAGKTPKANVAWPLDE